MINTHSVQYSQNPNHHKPTWQYATSKRKIRNNLNPNTATNQTLIMNANPNNTTNPNLDPNIPNLIIDTILKTLQDM